MWACEPSRVGGREVEWQQKSRRSQGRKRSRSRQGRTRASARGQDATAASESAARCARSMTIRCAKTFPPISSICSESSAKAEPAGARRMMTALASRFSALPTAAKLLLFISRGAASARACAGVGRAAAASAQANDANRARAEAQGIAATRAIESLIARNALALADRRQWRASPRHRRPVRERRAVAGAVARASPTASRSTTPTARRCARSAISADIATMPLVAPGDIRLWISPRQTIAVRAGRRDRRDGDRLADPRANCAARRSRRAAISTRLAISDGRARNRSSSTSRRRQDAEGGFSNGAIRSANGQLDVRIVGTGGQHHHASSGCCSCCRC